MRAIGVLWLILSVPAYAAANENLFPTDPCVEPDACRWLLDAWDRLATLSDEELQGRVEELEQLGIESPRINHPMVKQIDQELSKLLSELATLREKTKDPVASQSLVGRARATGVQLRRVQRLLSGLGHDSPEARIVESPEPTSGCEVMVNIQNNLPDNLEVRAFRFLIDRHLIRELRQSRRQAGSAVADIASSLFTGRLTKGRHTMGVRLELTSSKACGRECPVIYDSSFDFETRDGVGLRLLIVLEPHDDPEEDWPPEKRIRARLHKEWVLPPKP